MGTLVNTRNVSDLSPPQEMEYHVTVSHILGAESKDLSAQCAGEKAPKLCTVLLMLCRLGCGPKGWRCLKFTSWVTFTCYSSFLCLGLTSNSETSKCSFLVALQTG